MDQRYSSGRAGNGDRGAVSIPAPKRCATCGRTMTWRRKWARDWDQVRYCSSGCRRGLRDTDRALERAIIDLLEQRQRGATVCPSEAARLVDPARMNELMERTRNAARRLEASGRLVIMQQGRPVDSSTARGPIRLRKA